MVLTIVGGDAHTLDDVCTHPTFVCISSLHPLISCVLSNLITEKSFMFLFSKSYYFLLSFNSVVPALRGVGTGTSVVFVAHIMRQVRVFTTHSCAWGSLNIGYLAPFLQAKLFLNEKINSMQLNTQNACRRNILQFERAQIKNKIEDK